MTDDVRAVPLADLCGSVDYGITTSASVDGNGLQLLRITDIVPPSIDWQRVPRCDIDDRKASRFALRNGDTVVARTGATVGYAKRVRDLPGPVVFASYLVRFRVDASHDMRYVGYVVESAQFKEWVAREAGGAAQPNASASTLGRYPVPLPPFPEQRRIGGLLSVFDELIAINQRRIELLEHLARSLYRESRTRPIAKRSTTSVAYWSGRMPPPSLATATLGYVDQPRRPYYTMTYTVHGDTHETRAFDNLDQFDGVEPGDRVAVLVDPDDPDSAIIGAESNDWCCRHSAALRRLCRSQVLTAALSRGRRSSLRCAAGRGPARAPARRKCRAAWPVWLVSIIAPRLGLAVATEQERTLSRSVVDAGPAWSIIVRALRGASRNRSPRAMGPTP